MIKIMLSAGEVSGDLHGSFLASELKILNPNIYLFGMGGERMRTSGVDIKFDITSRGTIGIVEVFKHLPFIFYGLFKLRRLLKKEKPDLVVLIDYQGFNMIFASIAKRMGIKTVYYIPPQEWLWGKSKGVKKVATTIDKILCIFEEEAKIYKAAGGNAIYLGNPNLDIAKPTMNKETFCKILDLNPNFPVFGLFPGSRIQEIKSLTDIIFASAKKIKFQIPNAQFVVSLSSEHFRTMLENYIKQSGINAKLIYGKSHDILNISNVAIAASGTILMEAAIIGAPIIMIYKLSRLSYFIGKYILKIDLPYYCMPNILANKEVIPEIMQENVTVNNIPSKAIRLVTDQKALGEIKEGYKLIVSKLGRPGVVRRAAGEIFSELKGKI